LVALPSISIGFFSDDYALISQLKHPWLSRPVWCDLYQFTARTDEGNRALIEAGFLPWWSAPGLRFHFLRPLSSALLALDHALFGDAPLGWHLHSLVWWAVLLGVVRALYLRLLQGYAGVIALAAFAFATAHVQPYGWIASRHMTVAITFALLAVLAHIRAREDGWAPGRWLAPVFLALGLAAGEAALAGLAFWIAYEFAGPESLGDSRRRLQATTPGLAVLIVYAVLYKALQCGTAASAGYLDPLHAPVAFAAAAPTRFPALVANALLGVPAEFSVTHPALPFVVAGGAAAAIVALLWFATRPRIEPAERVTARWLVVGALATTVVGLGGYPGGRLLLGSDFGIMAVLGLIIQRGVGPGPWLRRIGAGFFGLVHIALAPLVVLRLAIPVTAWMSRANEAIAAAVPAEVPPGSTVFAIASDPMASVYVEAVLGFQGAGTVRCWSWLSGAAADHRLARLDDRTLSIEPLGRTFLEGPFERLYRSAVYPWKVGDEVEQCGARIRVAAESGGRPTRVEVRLPGPLDGGPFVVLAWNGLRLAPVIVPPVGQDVRLPRLPGPMGDY
jgi:hypothetical protein